MHVRFLKKLRDDRELSQYKMAQLLGILPETYAYYEGKAKGMKFKTLSELRRILNLTWNQLGEMIDEEAKEIERQTKKK